MKRARSVAFRRCFVVLVLAGGGCAGSNKSSAPLNYPQIEVRTASEIQSVMNAGFAPGAIVEVTGPGLKWSQAFGYSNVAGKVPMTTDTPFRIASLTKTFTASLLLSLEDQDKLNLSDQVDKYIPDSGFGGPSCSIVDPPTGPFVKMSIHQAGTMSSGVPDFQSSASFQQAFLANPTQQWTPSQMLAFAEQQCLLFNPGSSYTYSNTNGTLMGEVAVKASGLPIDGSVTSNFRTLLKQFIAPLHLTNTQFEGNLPANFSHGYAGSTDVTTSNTTSYPFAADMISTVDDLSVWFRAIGKPGLLSTNAITQRTQWTPLTNNADPDNHYAFGGRYAYGWFGHNGRVAGFNCAAYYNASIDATIVVMVNTSDYQANTTANTLKSDYLLRVLSANFFPSNPLSTQGDE